MSRYLTATSFKPSNAIHRDRAISEGKNCGEEKSEMKKHLPNSTDSQDVFAERIDWVYSGDQRFKSFYRGLTNQARQVPTSDISSTWVKLINSAHISTEPWYTHSFGLFGGCHCEQTNLSHKFFLRLLLWCSARHDLFASPMFDCFALFCSFAVCLSLLAAAGQQSNQTDKGGVYSFSNGHSPNGYSDEFMPQCLRPNFQIWAARESCELSNK